MLPATLSPAMADSQTVNEPIDMHSWQPILSSFQNPIPNLRSGCYPTDLNCDHAVDDADVALVADHWNCTIGDLCYDPAYDLDGNSIVDAFDLAWVANDYDVAPPEVTITAPR